MPNGTHSILVMTLQEFVQNIAEQFDDTDSSLFTPETDFQQFEEWGSLTALSIIAFVKMNYGKKITALDIRSCNSIQELYEFVENL